MLLCSTMKSFFTATVFIVNIHAEKIEQDYFTQMGGLLTDYTYVPVIWVY